MQNPKTGIRIKPLSWIIILLFSAILLLMLVYRISGKDDPQKNPMPAMSKSSVPVFFRRQQLDSVLKANFRESHAGQSLGYAYAAGMGPSGEQYLLIKRTEEGKVEVHESWDDVVVISAGRGILRTGRKVSGSREEKDTRPFRNWHGGSIADPEERMVAAGDFFIIPAGIAHQYLPAKNDSLVYWTMKIKRENSKD